MTIKCDIDLCDFEFTGGAAVTAEYLTDDDFFELEGYFNEEYPEGITEDELNDMFWFEDDFIARLLGYSTFAELEDDRMEIEED